MRGSLFLVLCACTHATQPMAAEDHVSSDPDLAEMFARFQERYKKKSLYASANDGVDRFAAFKENILKTDGIDWERLHPISSEINLEKSAIDENRVRWNE